MALLARNENRKDSLKKENEMGRSMGKKGRHSTKKIKANRSGMASDANTSANETGILRDLDKLA